MGSSYNPASSFIARIQQCIDWFSLGADFLPFLHHFCQCLSPSRLRFTKQPLCLLQSNTSTSLISSGKNIKWSHVLVECWWRASFTSWFILIWVNIRLAQWSDSPKIMIMKKLPLLPYFCIFANCKKQKKRGINFGSHRWWDGNLGWSDVPRGVEARHSHRHPKPPTQIHCNTATQIRSDPDTQIPVE